jgi:predicted metalloprotease with PDZ domain
LGGLRFRCGDQELTWRRDPVHVHAFHIALPDSADEIEAEFQLLSPTAQEQGRVGFTPRQLNLQWNTVVLYPAGHTNSQIGVQGRITLPQDWSFACSLEVEDQTETGVSFARAPLNRLVDSPLFAGLHCRRYQIDKQVSLNVFADWADQAEVGEAPLEGMKNLLSQADAIFGARPFRHYDFLLAVTDELGALGVEHHQSTEMVVPPDFFADWQGTASKNAVLAHEFLHAWNGKFRRERGSCVSSFDTPIRGELMWVYEGLTQYWGEVVAVRSGLWSADRYIGLLAQAAGKSALVKGRAWRPVQDTTLDPIIAARSDLPWLSWQRSEDYYSDGKLVWLDVDTLIRERSGEKRSLDDFGRAFFGGCQGEVQTIPYELEDILRVLEEICPYDWDQFFHRHIAERREQPPFGGIERGGYRLVFKEQPNDFHRDADKQEGLLDLGHSLGLSLDTEGKIKEVIWDGPAFRAGATAGSQVLAVNGWTFSDNAMQTALAACRQSGVTRLLVRRLKHCEELEIRYDGGPRYPHLVRNQEMPRLGDILKARQ